MIDRDKLISHLHQEEEQMLAGHIMDKIEMVLKRKSNESTNFLNPYQSEIAVGIIQQIYDVNFLIDGGYKRAERKRLTIFPEYLFPDHVKSPVAILKIAGNFNFQSVNHRDYLGAIMSLGIKREMIGDLLILDDFAQLVIAEELMEYVMMKLKKVHEVPVELSQITEKDIEIPEDNVKDITTTVASMRLDAIASAGFGDSRSKIARDIKNDNVKLNWKTENDPAQKVEINDLISIRGRGRIKVVEDRGLSHRGRIKLLIKKFV